ncbi:hypothetical protein ACFE04_012458 [Oxalis oulophora]
MALMNLKETELCLGLPGGGGPKVETPLKVVAAAAAAAAGNKRGFSETVDLKLNLNTKEVDLMNDNSNVSQEKNPAKPQAKAQVVGWPPVRNYRKNVMVTQQKKSSEDLESDQKKKLQPASSSAGAFVKVSMDGAPYLRKVDLKMYKTYQELSTALSKMFSSFTMGANYGNQEMIDFMNESKLMDLLNSSDYVPSYEDKDGDWMLVGDVPWEMFVDSCKRLRIMKGSEAIGLAPKAMEKCKSRA